MIAFLLLLVSGLGASLIIFPHRARRLDASRGGWRAVERARVPVHADDHGVYRHAGTVSILHSDVPPSVRVAVTLATALAPIAALVGVVGAISLESACVAAHLPPFAVAIAALLGVGASLYAAFVVDAAGAALLRRELAAEALARRALAIAGASLAFVTLASALTWLVAAPQSLDVELIAYCEASGAALAAAALLVRREAARYRRALNLV